MDVNYKKIVSLAIAVTAFAIIYLLPSKSIDTVNEEIQLTCAAKNTLAVLAFAVIAWVTEALPFPITALLSLSLMVITGCANLPDLVRDGFGNQIILFFIGVMIIAAVINQTSYVSKITRYIYQRFYKHPKYIILIVMSLGMVLAGFVTEMAAAAMILPFGISILHKANIQPLKDDYGKALMIACGWGPVIGGVSTPAGSGSNPLTIGFLKELAGINISFLDWMVIGLPAALLMLPCAWLILIKTFNVKDVTLPIETENKKIVTTANDRTVIVLFLMTILLWICEPLIHSVFPALHFIDMSFAAITTACLLFIPGISTVSWQKVEKSINWGAILLIVSGLAIGSTLYKTGAAQWLAWILFKDIGIFHPIVIVFLIVLGILIIKILFSSNTVTGVIMVPLMIALSVSIGIDTTLVALSAGLSASLSFILVTSTPTIMIPYSAGYFSIADMVKPGIYMTIIASICVTISFIVFGTLFNIISL